MITANHTPGRHAVVNQSTLQASDGRIIGTAYGWDGEPGTETCDASAEARANAVLWANAPDLFALLTEYLQPVLPEGFRSVGEWKADFDSRVRCALLRIAGLNALSDVRRSA